MAQYGLDVNDALAQEFTFELDYYGNYRATKTPAGLLKLSKFQSGGFELLQSSLNIETKNTDEILKTPNPGSELEDTGICLNFNHGNGADLFIEGLIIKPKKTAGLSLTRVTLRSVSDLEKLNNMPWDLAVARLYAEESGGIYLEVPSRGQAGSDGRRNALFGDANVVKLIASKFGF